MSELPIYLGVMNADHPVTIPTESADRLIRSMRRSNVLQVSGVHRAPTIVRGVEENRRIVHPVLGAEGKGYAGFPYAFRRLAMAAQRVPRGHIWNRRQSQGQQDESDRNSWECRKRQIDSCAADR